LKKLTKIVLILTLLVLAVVAVSPLVLSRSSEPCARCHSSRGYYQYLDIIEGDSGNQIPSTLAVEQTANVKVVIQNEVDSPRYTDLSSVSLTLRSVFGHFQVSSPTYSIGSLSPGTATATWQITGTSEGYDYLDIQASGYNSHFSCYFSDSYSPTQLITVGSPTGTPPPLPTPTPAPPTPTPTIPPSSTTSTQTSTPAPTTNPSNTPQPSTSPSTNQTELLIELISPTQGAHLPLNSKQTIQWQATGGIGTLKVKLEYIINNQQWTTLATDLPASGNYQWTTPDTVSTTAIRATVQDSSTTVQSTSTTTSFEVETTQPFDWTIIAIAAAIVVVLVIVVVVVIKMRAKKPL
jgi:hypothetical protein